MDNAQGMRFKAHRRVQCINFIHSMLDNLLERSHLYKNK